MKSSTNGFQKTCTRFGPLGQRGIVGITLLELLVTISVIGVLATFLMPALRSARRKADSVRCISNLRHLGIAVRLCADENEGRLPSAKPFRQTQTNVASELPVIQEILTTYLNGATNVFRCPSDKGGVVLREGSSYEWNASLNGRILHRVGEGHPEEKSSGVFLLRDREAWHRGDKRNAVFSDGHTGTDSL